MLKRDSLQASRALFFIKYRLKIFPKKLLDGITKTMLRIRCEPNLWSELPYYCPIRRRSWSIVLAGFLSGLLHSDNNLFRSFLSLSGGRWLRAFTAIQRHLTIEMKNADNKLWIKRRKESLDCNPPPPFFYICSFGLGTQSCSCSCDLPRATSAPSALQHWHKDSVS